MDIVMDLSHSNNDIGRYNARQKPRLTIQINALSPSIGVDNRVALVSIKGKLTMKQNLQRLLFSNNLYKAHLDM